LSTSIRWTARSLNCTFKNLFFLRTADLLLSLGADVNLWVGLHIGNKKSVDLPIVHHVVDISTLYVPFMNNPAEENPMDAAIAKFREPSLKWLLEHVSPEILLH